MYSLIRWDISRGECGTNFNSDNYQGEESDIVIASLTRSNPSGDIGFMKAPERLNVLLSRARDCLILIGNPETFMKSPQGRDTWLPFFNILKEAGQLHDGFPVKCEQHPDRTALLREPLDFDKYCPDGGCAEPWSVLLIVPYAFFSGVSLLVFEISTRTL